VKISVSFEKDSYYESEATFQYLDVNSKNDLLILFKSMKVSEFDIVEKKKDNLTSLIEIDKN
jgi:hypothetical protein